MSYTKVDNWLFDVVMPQAKSSTLRIVLAVARMTAGWQRDTARISYNDFQTLTGIAGRTHIKNAIDDAIANGWIERKKSGMYFEYQLVTLSDYLNTKPVTLSHQYQSPKVTSSSHLKSPVPVTLSHQLPPTEIKGKKNIKKNIKEKEPTPPDSYFELQAATATVTGKDELRLTQDDIATIRNWHVCGYTAQNILQAYDVKQRDAFWRGDWRWKKNRQHPTIRTIDETLGAAKLAQWQYLNGAEPIIESEESRLARETGIY